MSVIARLGGFGLRAAAVSRSVLYFFAKDKLEEEARCVRIVFASMKMVHSIIFNK